MALVSVEYIGGYDEVWVVGAEVVCKKGESIEVAEGLAGELLVQVTNWAPGNEEAEKFVPPPAQAPLVTTTVDYVLGSSVEKLFADATAKNLKITVPAASANKNRTIYVANTATNANTVAVIAAGGLIRGAGLVTEKEITIAKGSAYVAVTLVSDGTYWNLV